MIAASWFAIVRTVSRSSWGTSPHFGQRSGGSGGVRPHAPHGFFFSQWSQPRHRNRAGSVGDTLVF
jgi:hypothetical protein